jgi:tetratricopeptide (TPR) repeat protein
LDTAATLDKLAALLESKGDHAEAEQLLRRSLSIRESALEPQHPQTAKSLESLGELLPVTQKAPSAYSAAVPLYRRALTIFQNSLGPAHPDTVPLEEKLHLVEKQRRLFWLSGLVIFLFIAAGCLALGHHLGLL